MTSTIAMRSLATLVIAALVFATGCKREQREFDAQSPAAPAYSAVTLDTLQPGVPRPELTVVSKAEGNAYDISEGKRLFSQWNCAGCHSHGGGGMGPPLMDNEWIYGGRLEQIHQTLVEGRPNGMPTWGGKIPDEQLWQISAYVRSMSLPATLAAQYGPTPSQAPAPVPRAADQDSGWSPPEGTTNDYTTTLEGPK